jgi:hypothetical protein
MATLKPSIFNLILLLWPVKYDNSPYAIAIDKEKFRIWKSYDKAWGGKLNLAEYPEDTLYPLIPEKYKIHSSKFLCVNAWINDKV